MEFSVEEKKVTVAGAARSGIAVARLLVERGAQVTLSDARADVPEAQPLAGMNGVRGLDVVPQGQVERGQAVLRGDPVHVLSALHHHGGAVFRLRDADRALAGRHAHVARMRTRFTGDMAAAAGGEQREDGKGEEDSMRAHAPHHAPCPRNSSQPTAAASSKTDNGNMMSPLRV